MAVDNAPYDFRKDLVRNVITEPLYTDILADSAAIVNIIIDVNLQYHQGREAAFAAVIELAKEALAGKDIARASDLELPRSVGSASNPFMSAKLPGFIVQEMVRLDGERGRQSAQAPRREAEVRVETEAPARAEAPPINPAPYRAMYRIWENFAVHPLIDRSISIVKADAARRAFLAEGKDIVWAVIDSGVDRMHEHFKDAATLDVKLPLRHFDFTVREGEEEQPLVDSF